MFINLKLKLYRFFYNYLTLLFDCVCFFICDDTREQMRLHVIEFLSEQLEGVIVLIRVLFLIFF